MRIKREELLNQLEQIRPGLSAREIIEQSNCYVFRGGKVQTYNDEVACTMDCCLNGIEGAVHAEPLVQLLQKLPVEWMEITTGDGELLVTAKQRTSGITMQQDILLPVEQIETPQKWKKLPPDFAEAVDIVSQCASNDESTFILTCIHITPDHIEACDNYQLSRFPMKTGVKQESLARKSSLVHIMDLGMTEFSETQSWLHFRNPSGLVMSCRRTIEDYPSLDHILSAKGEPTTLPTGLVDATETAEIFSSQNAENNQVTVELRKDRLRITGEGASGWYKEVKRLKYRGQSLKFVISPKLLIELTKRHNECEVAEERLVVNGGRFVFVTCLGKVEGD